MVSEDGRSTSVTYLRSLGVCANVSRKFLLKNELPAIDCSSPMDQSLNLTLARMHTPIIILSRLGTNFPASA